jgi:hypothetical protein
MALIESCGLTSRRLFDFHFIFILS